jgi:hypothetical protein
MHRAIRRSLPALGLACVALCAVSWPASAADPGPLPPAPRFDWMAPGQHRPAPRIASVTLGCDETPTQACLDKSWSDLLAAFDQGPLTAPAGGRSYRMIWLRSFHAPVAVRIDVSAAGAAVLTTRWARRVNGEYGASGLQPAPAALTWGELGYLEDALKQNGFSQIVADESALPEGDQMICNDGAEWVIEAVVGDRYRYVSGGCRRDQDRVLAIGLTFIKIARRRTPNVEFEPVY